MLLDKNNSVIINLIEEKLSLKEKPFFKQCSISPFIYSSEKINQFLLLIKPELLQIVHKDIVSEMIFIILKALNNHGITIHECALFNGRYCKKNQIIQKTYPILNQVSENGIAGCHKSAKQKLTSSVDMTKITVLGSKQFLKFSRNFNSLNLRELNDQIGAKKFGSGIYGIQLTCEGKNLLILNAFFPQMLKDFNVNSARFLALNCSSLHSWAFLREHVVGYIDPKNASALSLRNTIYHLQPDIKPKIFDISHNGFHISPGPFEGQIQLESIFGSKKKYNFKDLLGNNKEQLLKKNLKNTDIGEIYEKTENINTFDAVKIMKRRTI